MRTKALVSVVAVLLFTTSCGSNPAFKEDVAKHIHGQCAAGLDAQAESKSLLQEAGRTIADACECAVNIVADNYSVLDLTMMGDETMNVVFTNAGRTCAERFASD